METCNLSKSNVPTIPTISKCIHSKSRYHIASRELSRRDLKEIIDGPLGYQKGILGGIVREQTAMALRSPITCHGTWYSTPPPLPPAFAHTDGGREPDQSIPFPRGGYYMKLAPGTVFDALPGNAHSPRFLHRKTSSRCKSPTPRSKRRPRHQ